MKADAATFTGILVHLRSQGTDTWCGAGWGYNEGDYTFVPENSTCGDCLIKAYEFGDRAKRRWKKLGGP